MIKLGAIEFQQYPGGKLSPYQVTLVGRLTVGSILQFHKGEFPPRGPKRDRFILALKDEIRHNIHASCYGEVRQLLQEAQRNIMSSISSVSDIRRIDAEFQKLFELFSYPSIIKKES